MRKTGLLIATLCAFLLQGCLATTKGGAPREQALQWQIIEVPEPDMWIKRLAFSPDGEHFLVAHGYRYVDLYNLDSTERVWSFAEDKHTILSAEFIDSETFIVGARYIAEMPDSSGRRNTVQRLSIRPVATPDQEEVLEFPKGRDLPMTSNGDFIYYDNQLLDRRDGRIHRVITAHPGGPKGRLTGSGKVLTEADGEAVLYDYATQDYLHWCADCRFSLFTQAGGAYDITASERFVITNSYRGNCYARTLPALKSIGRCGFSLSFRTETPLVQPHPVADRVAVAWGQRLRVYDLDPFHLVFETQLDGTVTGIALSADRQLAASFPGGRILVWHLDDGRLLGYHDTHYNHPHGIPNDLMSFSPDGRKLLVTTGLDAPVLLDIPE